MVGMVRMMYVGHENAMCLRVREQDVRAVHGRYGYLLRGVDAWLEREERCISLRAPSSLRRCRRREKTECRGCKQ